MADAKRNKLADSYAAVREAAKERQKESPGRPKKGQEQIPEVFEDNAADHGEKQPTAPQTRDIRAKAAGTNAKYIDLADKVLDTRPDLAAEVEAGTKTLSQVQRDLRREEMVARQADCCDRP